MKGFVFSILWENEEVQSKIDENKICRAQNFLQSGLIEVGFSVI